MSVDVCMYVCIYLFIYLFIHLFSHLFIHLLIYFCLFVCLFFLWKPPCVIGCPNHLYDEKIPGVRKLLPQGDQF